MWLAGGHRIPGGAIQVESLVLLHHKLERNCQQGEYAQNAGQDSHGPQLDASGGGLEDLVLDPQQETHQAAL